MKILHITASYKPAFIYGGPIYSVAALCEALVNEVRSPQSVGLSEGKGLSGKEERLKAVNEVSSQQSAGLSEDKVFSGKEERLNAAAIDDSQTVDLQVITTLANGKKELPYFSGEQQMVEGVPVRYFKRITKDHSHFSPSLLFWLWNNAKRYEVIHVHSWWNLVSMASVLICLLKGIRPIISPRGMLGDYTFSTSKLFFHQLLGKILLKRCNFHATTKMETDEIESRVFNSDEVEVVDLMEEKGEWLKVNSEGYKVEGVEQERARSKEQRRKITVIHNLVKLPEKLPVNTQVFDGTLKLIFLSRIHPKKGIELLLDALALVNFPFKLSIVGEGDLEYIESLKLKAESLKLQDFISWTGAVYGDEKYQLLANHDLFVLPSYNENFANVVIEAIAVGTPVLLSEHVGLRDYVNTNNYGLVFKLDELKPVLEEAYSLFVENKLSIKGTEAINNKALIPKYLKMYDSICNI